MVYCSDGRVFIVSDGPTGRYLGCTRVSLGRYYVGSLCVLELVLFLEGIILPVQHIHFRALCNVCTRRGDGILLEFGTIAIPFIPRSYSTTVLTPHTRNIGIHLRFQCRHWMWANSSNPYIVNASYR